MKIYSRHILLCIVLLLTATIAFNYAINKIIEGKSAHIQPALPAPMQKQKAAADSSKNSPGQQPPELRVLVPENPAKYGILVQQKDELPRNQLAWDVFMEKALLQSNVIAHMDSQRAFEKMQKTPEEFQARVREIDGLITKYQKMRLDDPLDKTIDDKLQKLYMMKSTLKILENKVVIK